MANVFVDEKHLQDIANNIRRWAMTYDTYKPKDMAIAIQTVYDKGNADGYKSGYDVGYDDSQKMWAAYWANTGEHFELPDGMTEIYERMFYNHKTLSSITVPNTVTKIGTEAFYGCSGLLSFPMNDEITEMGAFAFYGCKVLNVTKLPPLLKIIPSAIFAACPSVKIRTLPDGVTDIIAYAFDSATSNNTAVIPASVVNINNGAFAKNLGMTELTFLGTPSFISNNSGIEAFSNCTNLKKINVPWQSGQVAGAPWGATNAEIVYDFWNVMQQQSSVSFPIGLTEVSANLFQNNTTIQNLTLGDDITAIRPYAFNGCSNLKTVKFSNNLHIIEEFSFFGCPNLEVTELPDSVYEIESAAFAGLSKVSLSKLPDNLGKLETYCFQKCNNTFTEIPAGVICISKLAFGDNLGLTKLTFKGTPLKNGISAEAFSGCVNLKEVNVPWAKGAVDNAPWGLPSDCVITYNYK